MWTVNAATASVGEMQRESGTLSVSALLLIILKCISKMNEKQNQELDWKLILLQRWAGEFPPASPTDGDFTLKSSQEIADDLSTAGRFSPNEISKFLAVNGYAIEFEGGYPFWKIQKSKTKLIEQ